MTIQLEQPETKIEKQKRVLLEKKKVSRDKAIAKELANIEKLKKQYAGQLQIKEQYVSTHLWEFYKPFKWQEDCGKLCKEKTTILAPSPNGIGKTTEMVVRIMSWLAGYEAWNEVDVDYPGAVKKGKKYFKPSSLGIKPPIRGRLTGNDWSHHLGQTVVRELKKWFPMDEFDTKNNTQGVTWFWTHKPTGSTLELMTHDQKISLYESWRGHFGAADEPPSQEIYEAFTGRALTENGGKYLILATPLTQAWMLDVLVLKNDRSIGIMKDLCCLDNEISYDHDDKILTEMGLTGKRTKYWREMEGQKKIFFDLIMRRDLYIDIGDDGASSGPPDDQGLSAEKFLIDNIPEEMHDRIMDLQFLRKAKNTSLEDKPSRFFGMFKKLVGLVVKEFNKAKHILRANIKDGSVLPYIPTNWPVAFQIDFHLSKPHAVAFYAWDERNIQYCIDEVWENMPAEDIASLIIRRKKVECWNINYGEIDPLSKGDDKYMKNRDADAVSSFSILEELLADEGIELGVASKDKKSGFSNIKAGLKGANGIPSTYFLDSLQSIKDNRYGVVYEIQRLCYDDNGEIEKKDDHFMECFYRSKLMGVSYDAPRAPVMPSASGSGEGGWLGA